MALLTHQWQQPDVDSLVRLALMGREQDRQAAIQQLEHQQAVQKNAQDLALQLAQQRRIEDQQQFKNSLDVATLMQHGALANARAARLAALSNKPGIAPLTLPDADSTSPALPTSDDSAAPAMDPAASMLLNASGTPTDAQALSLSSPSPFSLQLAGQSPSIDPVSAGIMQSQANPIPDPDQPIISPDADQTSDATPSAFQPTDFAGMMRDTAAQGADFPQAAPAATAADTGDGPPDTQQTWANLRAQGGLPANPTVPGNAAGPGLSGEPDLFGGQQVPGGPGTASGGISPSGSIRQAGADPVTAAFNNLSPSDQALVRAQNKLVARGQAKPGSDAALLQQLGMRAGRPGASAKAPLQGSDGNYYQPGVMPPAGVTLTRIGTATGSGQSRQQYLDKNYPDGVETTKVNGVTAYKDQDGAMFTLNSSGGKWKEINFNPNSHPARMKMGTDGLTHTVDASGNPVDPLPDGVALGQPPKWDKTNEGATVSILGPDGKYATTLLIPKGLKMSDAMADSYKDAFDALHDATELKAAAEKNATDNPDSDKKMFGGSKLADVTDTYNAALAKVKKYWNDFPQLANAAAAFNSGQKPPPPGVVAPPVPAPMASPSAAPAPQAAPAAPKTRADGKVAVVDPSGQAGWVAPDKLQAALANGYKLQ